VLAAVRRRRAWRRWGEKADKGMLAVAAERWLSERRAWQRGGGRVGCGRGKEEGVGY
jgi:hypothetical protein